jgi:hypothetical protein
MTGHGSPPPPDRALDASRAVHRDSGLHKSSFFTQVGNEAVSHTIEEFRPPVGSPESRRPRTPQGTRFRWAMAPQGDEFHGRVATTASLKRAQIAVTRSGQRYAERKDRFTGR